MPGDSKPAAAADTVNDIVTEVEELLRRPDGVRQTERLTEHYRRVADFDDDARRHAKRLGRRPDVAFYTSVAGAEGRTLVVDVRIAGESCGEIRLGAVKERKFYPRNHLDHWEDDWGDWLEWRDGRVRAYLEKAAASIATRPREATVEAAFLVALAESRGREKQRLLVGHQPVCIAGLPFQFPLPISARAGAKITAGGGGHADVLARAASKRLRVIEVKKPRAGDAAKALHQAIIYAATLRHLLAGEPSAAACARMLGYSKWPQPIRIEAVALVDESYRDQVVADAKRLNGANRHFDLAAMFYRWTEDGSRRLEITAQTRFEAVRQ